MTGIVGKDREISGVNSLNLAGPTELTFYTGKDKIFTSSEVIICTRNVELEDKTYFIVDNPRLEFIRIATQFFPPRNYIPPRPIIGRGCIIHGSINWGVVSIGDNVKIGPNSSVGYRGFGYERDKDGTLLPFPHYGGVVIENNVEIARNVCIDRGTFGDTIIGEGTKVDNLVHIAHNVKIGRNCMIIAGSILCGSVVIEDNVWVAPNATIKEGVTVGEGSMIGLAANVLKDVEPNSVMIGNPARRLH